MFSLSRILSYLWPQVKKYRWSFLLSFIGYGGGVIFSGIINPLVYKQVIDGVATFSKGTVTVEHIFTLVFISIGIRFIFNIFYRMGDFAMTHTQSGIMQELHNFAFDKLLNHSYHFFTNNFSGSLVAKAKRFSRSFENAHDVLMYNVWFAAVLLLGVLVVLFSQSPQIALFFLLWVAVYVYITILFIRKKVKLDLLEAEADSSVTGSYADAFVNIINIKMFSGKSREVVDFQDVTQDEADKRSRAWNFANIQNFVQGFLMMILFSVASYLSIYYWHKGLVSIGTIVLIQVYMDGIFDQLWNLGKAMTKMIKSLSEMQEIVDIFEMEPDILEPVKPEPLRMSSGHIVFNDVSFNYEGNSDVFAQFNLDIKPGERVGLVGHSGAGKSTITKLLLRFSDVTGGAITIDDQDIRNVVQDDLRSVISYVPQESILFHRSIRDNIAYGKNDATLDEVISVAKQAHAHEFISKLSKGYDTLVGERGIKLSGGERQRVAIARAMIKNSPVLVLDEATSSLDSVSESFIQEALDKLMEGKTTIVIAHRLSTIQKMDRILVLDAGKIVEQGTHKELLKKKGVYAELWDHQSGGFIE
jgi:ATP-binding cassette subfamily B protein